jgi:hypothetical protein
MGGGRGLRKDKVKAESRKQKAKSGGRKQTAESRKQ